MEPEEFPTGTHDVVNIYVGGRRLQDMVRPVEQGFADAEGTPDLAGSYAGMHDLAIRWPSRHFLGNPVLSWFGDGDTILLGCICGDPGCWPLTARVEVTEEIVTWRNFRTGHRDWDLSTFGPLVFDRGQYERALQSTGGG